MYIDTWLLRNTQCTTCQKAVGYLQEKGVPIRGYRNLKEQPLSEDEVRVLAAKVGGVEKLFSKRAMKYRAMGLHERELSGRRPRAPDGGGVHLRHPPRTRPRRPRDGGVLGEAGGRAGGVSLARLAPFSKVVEQWELESDKIGVSLSLWLSPGRIPIRG